MRVTNPNEMAGPIEVEPVQAAWVQGVEAPA